MRLGIFKKFFGVFTSILLTSWGIIEIYAFFNESTFRSFVGNLWWVYFLLIAFIAILVVLYQSRHTQTGITFTSSKNPENTLNYKFNYIKLLHQDISEVLLFENQPTIPIRSKSIPSLVQVSRSSRVLSSSFLPEKQELTFQTIEEGFEYYGRQVLFAGDSGTGKTIGLLQCALKCANEFLKNPSSPFPIVVSLHDWNFNEEKSLPKWLSNVTSLPVELIESEEIILFLDGLDEITHSALPYLNSPQNSLTKEIIVEFNKFIKNRFCVVSCRLEYYRSLNIKLDIRGAIYLQELEEIEIEKYLRDNTEVLTFIKSNKDFWKLAKTPLLLSLLKQTTLETLRKGVELPSSEEKVDFLFANYVKSRYDYDAIKRKPKLRLDQIYQLLGKLAISDILGEKKFEINFNKLRRLAGDNLAAIYSLMTRKNKSSYVFFWDRSSNVIKRRVGKHFQYLKEINLITEIGKVYRFPHYLIRNHIALYESRVRLNKLRISKRFKIPLLYFLRLLTSLIGQITTGDGKRFTLSHLFRASAIGAITLGALFYSRLDKLISNIVGIDTLAIDIIFIFIITISLHLLSYLFADINFNSDNDAILTAASLNDKILQKEVRQILSLEDLLIMIGSVKFHLIYKYYSSIPDLINIVKTGNWLMRTKARVALIYIGEPTVPYFVDMLKSKNFLYAWRAAWALGKIGNQRAIDALVYSYNNDPRPSIRKTVLDAIRQIETAQGKSIPLKKKRN